MDIPIFTLTWLKVPPAWRRESGKENWWNKDVFLSCFSQCSDSVDAKMEEQTILTTIYMTKPSLTILKLLKQDSYNFQTRYIGYKLGTKQRGGSIIFHKIWNITTSPFLTVSTTFYWKGRPLLSKLQPKIRWKLPRPLLKTSYFMLHT